MSDLKQLETLLRLGKITRREFMTRATALGAAAAVAPSMLIGEAQAAPKRGGHMRAGIAQGSTTDSLDPATTLHSYTQLINNSLYNYLTEVDADGKARPELAEALEASPDAKVWTVKLRRGVEFHNGKSLEAEDVIASINHHRGEESKSAAKSILDPVVSVKADGKHTVVFELSGGNADFPYIVSDYHIGIMPSKNGKVVDPTSGIGCGGYMLENFDPGVKTLMKRNPNYWKSDRAFFDSVEMLAIKDVAARTNALTTGEVDAIDRCDLKTVHLLKRNRDVEINSVTGTQHYSMAMITTVAPFDNNDVRLALKYAIDRDALVKTILRGHGRVANDHPISPANAFFNKDLAQRPYDPDRAKFHLKKAGMSSLKVDLSASDGAWAGAVDAAVLYREHAAKAGIDLNVVREPADGYWSNVWMKKPYSMVYWGGRPTEDWMFSIAYAADAAWNDSFWKHKRFNELLVAARAELDQNKRRAMYYEMQEIVSNEGGVLVAMYANYVFAVSKKVGHGKIASNWDMDGIRAWERWWFA